jgi:hypothetical protein
MMTLTKAVDVGLVVIDDLNERVLENDLVLFISQRNVAQPENEPV